MRQAYLITAAILVATSAGAQTSADCSGATVSELSDCVARQTEQAVQPLSPRTGPVRVQPIRPANLGGSWKPVDLRVAPPLAPPPIDGGGGSMAPLEAGAPLPPGAGISTAGRADGRATYDASQIYEVNGRIVRIDPDTREVIEDLGPANRGSAPNAGVFPVR